MVVPAQAAGDDACVEVTARIPHVNMRVTLAIDVEPGQEPATAEAADVTAGRGSSVPRLMLQGAREATQAGLGKPARGRYPGCAGTLAPQAAVVTDRK